MANLTPLVTSKQKPNTVSHQEIVDGESLIRSWRVQDVRAVIDSYSINLEGFNLKVSELTNTLQQNLANHKQSGDHDERYVRIDKDFTATYAKQLENPVNINGTSFNGKEGITTEVWGKTITFTIGGQTVSVNGSGDVEFSLEEMGVSTGEHSHQFEDLEGVPETATRWPTTEEVGAQEKSGLSILLNQSTTTLTREGKENKVVVQRTVAGNSDVLFNGSDFIVGDEIVFYINGPSESTLSIANLNGEIIGPDNTTKSSIGEKTTLSAPGAVRLMKTGVGNTFRVIGGVI